MSSILKFLGINTCRKSATIARERLQIVLSHQRLSGGQDDPDFLPRLRNELVNVICKYVNIDQDQINVQLQRSENFSTLELNITLPTTTTQ